ncbi:MAG: hypothetical protein ACREPQ_09770 [Rhodanobacter sp.]
MTVGTKVDPAVVATFKPGVTTVAQAESQLGQPNQVTQMPDGGTLLVYNFVSTKASGSTFIPVAGAFVGHSDSQNQMTELFFDQQGFYQKSWATSGQTSAGMINHQ